jgi:hypothetical protein
MIRAPVASFTPLRTPVYAPGFSVIRIAASRESVGAGLVAVMALALPALRECQ